MIAAWIYEGVIAVITGMSYGLLVVEEALNAGK
jgi:hypothetical protein